MQHYAVIIFPSLLTSFDFPNASPRKLFYCSALLRPDEIFVEESCFREPQENPAAAELRLESWLGNGHEFSLNLVNVRRHFVYRNNLFVERIGLL